MVQLEIENKYRLPREVKKQITNKVFYTLVVAIILVLYFLAINITYYNFESNIFEHYLKYFALGISIVTVITFEVGYRKNSKEIAIIGVELFICGILSLYIPYIFLHTTQKLRIIFMVVPVGIVIYYFIKSFIIYKRDKTKYINDHLSDVKDLLKSDERKSYLDEDSSKTYRKKVEEENEIKKVIQSEQAARRKKRQEFIKNNKKGEKKVD